jgi:hypothetical protein
MKPVCFLTLTFLALGVVVASAQWAPSSVAITYIEGYVYVDGKLAPQPKSVLSENSVVHTGKGRAEILFGRGDAMFLDENSSVRVNRDSKTGSAGLEILTGSAVVITGTLGPSVSCVQDSQLSDAGVFRFDVHQVVGENFCKLRVYKGAAAAQMPSFIWVLTPGKTVDLNRSCGDHTPRDEFSTTDIDGLDRWSRQRDLTEARH